jgi:endonuclease/exonuclease/phosphatase family metal-dependent hydrolase
LDAKIGKEEHQMKVAGKYAVHDISNEIGNLLGQFATRNGLKMKAQPFHINIHLGTWKMPGSNEVNQIDHVLVSLRHCTSEIDVRSSRGPNCDTDHYLVKIRVGERIASIQEKERVKPKKWDV